MTDQERISIRRAEIKVELLLKAQDLLLVKEWPEAARSTQDLKILEAIQDGRSELLSTETLICVLLLLGQPVQITFPAPTEVAADDQG